MSRPISLSTPMNPAGNGLDWDLIRDDYIKRCSPEEREWQLASLNGNVNVTQRATASRNQRKKPEMPNAISKDKKELIINYYQAGNRVNWIAKEVGVSAKTTREIIKASGEYDPTRDRSRK